MFRRIAVIAVSLLALSGCVVYDRDVDRRDFRGYDRHYAYSGHYDHYDRHDRHDWR